MLMRHQNQIVRTLLRADDRDDRQLDLTKVTLGTRQYCTPADCWIVGTEDD